MGATFLNFHLFMENLKCTETKMSWTLDDMQLPQKKMTWKQNAFEKVIQPKWCNAQSFIKIYEKGQSFILNNITIQSTKQNIGSVIHPLVSGRNTFFLFFFYKTKTIKRIESTQMKTDAKSHSWQIILSNLIDISSYDFHNHKWHLS